MVNATRIYLQCYNAAQLVGWTLVAVANAMNHAYMPRLTAIMQAFMVLDLVHSLLQLTHNSAQIVFHQLVLRNGMAIFVLNDSSFELPFSARVMVFAWSASEIARYLYYVWRCEVTKLLRYKLFPLWFAIGIFCGELPTMFAHLKGGFRVCDAALCAYFVVTVFPIFKSLLMRRESVE